MFSIPIGLIRIAGCNTMQTTKEMLVKKVTTRKGQQRIFFKSAQT